MTGINKLVKTFNTLNPDYHMELSKECTDPEGYVLVYVTEPVW